MIPRYQNWAHNQPLWENINTLIPLYPIYTNDFGTPQHMQYNQRRPTRPF